MRLSTLSEGVADLTVPLDKARDAKSEAGLVASIAIPERDAESAVNSMRFDFD